MKKHLRLLRLCYCFLLAPFFSQTSFAQNWQPIPNNDTVYFTTPSNELAVLWIDSVRQLNTDSIFYFQPSIKLVDPFDFFNSSGSPFRCVDTLGGGFLGKFFIKKEDSIYLLKDIYGDTITLKPFRNIGQTWIYKMDTAQIEIRATITDKTTRLINEDQDSVITIQLQAFQANQPIPYILNRQMQLSKSHGFMEVYNLHKIKEDFAYVSFQMKPIETLTQLEKSKYIVPRANRIDFYVNLFTAGNMFIYKYNQQGFESERKSYYIMDSIIEGTKLNDSTFIKKYKHGYYSKLIDSLIIIEDLRIDTVQFGPNTPTNYLQHCYPYWNNVNDPNNAIAPFITTQFVYDTLSKIPSFYKFEDDMIFLFPDTCYLGFKGSLGLFTWIEKYISPYDSVFTITINNSDNFDDWYNESYQSVYSKIGNQITGYNPLPALDFSLQGIHRETGNDLYWKTSEEINTDYFIIERNNNHQTFEEIGQQKAAGNSHTLLRYSFKDNELPVDANSILYRIKLVDIDRKISYSNTISLSNRKPIEFSISPIPCKENIQLHYQSSLDETLEIILLGIEGARTKLTEISWHAGQTEATMTLPSSLVKGIYYLDVFCTQANQHHRLKLIKE